MKVKMLVCRSGQTGVDKVGDIIDIDAAEGGRMIAAGQAELCQNKPKIEKATQIKNASKKKK